MSSSSAGVELTVRVVERIAYAAATVADIDPRGLNVIVLIAEDDVGHGTLTVDVRKGIVQEVAVRSAASAPNA